MKRPDIVLLIAIWEFISAFIALIAICAIAVFAFPSAIGSMWEFTVPAAIFGLSVAVLFLLGYIGLAISAGIGLLRMTEWGRILSIVHSALSLFSVPVGTTIGVLAIVYLSKPEVADLFKTGGKARSV